MEQNTSDSLFGLQVDTESGAYFKEASKWARFIAIVYFVVIVLFALVLAFSSEAIMEGFNQVYPGLDVVGGALITTLAVAGIVGLVLMVLLYRFGSLTRQGVDRPEQTSFNEGLKSLKYYFLVMGIISVLSLLFSLIGAIGRVVAPSINL